MKLLQITLLCLTGILLAGQGHALHTLNDALAFSGLTSTRAIYDVRTADEKTLQFIFTAIRDTLNETVQQDVKPRYIVSMRGPSVKLLVRNSQSDAAVQQKTTDLIKELNQQGVRLEACGYALNLFNLEEEDLYEGLHAVGNSLNSLIAYQIKGYALVPMY